MASRSSRAPWRAARRLRGRRPVDRDALRSPTFSPLLPPEYRRLAANIQDDDRTVRSIRSGPDLSGRGARGRILPLRHRPRRATPPVRALPRLDRGGPTRRDDLPREDRRGPLFAAEPPARGEIGLLPR